MTKTIEIIKEVKVTIPDGTLESMFNDYKSCIDSTATLDDLFMQIGWSIGTSDSSFVEGCGEDGKDFIIESNETVETNVVE